MSETKPFSLANDVPHEAINKAHKVDERIAKGLPLRPDELDVPAESDVYPDAQVHADNVEAYHQEVTAAGTSLKKIFNIENRLDQPARKYAFNQQSEFDRRTGNDAEAKTKVADHLDEAIAEFLLEASKNPAVLSQGLPDISKALKRGIEHNWISPTEALALKVNLAEASSLSIASQISSESYYAAEKVIDQLITLDLYPPEAKTRMQEKLGETISIKSLQYVEAGRLMRAEELLRQMRRIEFLSPEKSRQICEQAGKIVAKNIPELIKTGTFAESSEMLERAERAGFMTAEAVGALQAAMGEVVIPLVIARLRQSESGYAAAELSQRARNWGFMSLENRAKLEKEAGVVIMERVLALLNSASLGDADRMIKDARQMGFLSVAARGEILTKGNAIVVDKVKQMAAAGLYDKARSLINYAQSEGFISAQQVTELRQGFPQSRHQYSSRMD